jgi:hypothetical protein
MIFLLFLLIIPFIFAPKYLLLISIIYLFFHYVIPFIKVRWYNYILEKNTKKLDPNCYNVIKNVKIPEYSHKQKNKKIIPYSKTGKCIFMNYLIVSKYGIFVIKLVNFKRSYSGIIGYENKEKWTHIKFGRMWLPFIGGVGNKKRKINNPILQTQKFIADLKKELNCNFNNRIFHPIIVIIPKLKVVDPSSLLNVINKFRKKKKISSKKINDFYYKLKDYES